MLPPPLPFLARRGRRLETCLHAAAASVLPLRRFAQAEQSLEKRTAILFTFASGAF
jgi:hypothetical protein